MARIYSDIRNFKSLESDLRKITLSLSKAIEKIERTQRGKHSKPDLEALKRARGSWREVHEGAKQALAKFRDDVEAAC